MTAKREILTVLVALAAALAIHAIVLPLAAVTFHLGRFAKPDLVIRSATVPRPIMAEKPTAIRFVVRNVASTATPKRPWTDGVYLSTDKTLDGEDQWLGDHQRVKPLGPGDRYRTEPVRITLPRSEPEHRYLLLKTDTREVIDESPREANNVLAVRLRVLSPQAKPQRLGKADSREPIKVAWISHEDFRELQARRGRTKQPALQRHAEPLPQAPPRLHAAERTAQMSQPTPRPGQSTRGASKSQTKSQTSQPRVSQRPATAASNSVKPGTKQAVKADSRSASTAVTKTPSPTEGGSASQTSTQSASRGGSPQSAKRQPTSADRSDRESTPTQPQPQPTVVRHTGKVKVAEGLEVKTVAPKFSAVTQASALPRNPIARVTFNGEGQVMKVDLIRTSGAENVDGPVIAALYKWKATGKKLRQIEPPITRTFRIVLVEE